MEGTTNHILQLSRQLYIAVSILDCKTIIYKYIYLIVNIIINYLVVCFQSAVRTVARSGVVGSREPEKQPIRSATPAKPSHLPFDLQNSSVHFLWQSPSLSLLLPHLFFSLFALKHISQCSRGMSMSQLSLFIPSHPPSTLSTDLGF
jgi:hypothetical protein